MQNERNSIPYTLRQQTARARGTTPAKVYYTVDLMDACTVRVTSKDATGKDVSTVDTNASVTRLAKFMTFGGLFSYCQDMLDNRLRSYEHPVKDGKELTLTDAEKQAKAIEYIKELEVDTRIVSATPEKQLERLGKQLAALYSAKPGDDNYVAPSDIPAKQAELLAEMQRVSVALNA